MSRKLIILSTTIILCFFESYALASSDTLIIKEHLKEITKTDLPRNYKNVDVLNEVANYLFEDFQKFSDSVSFQEFQVNGEIYKNVIAKFGSGKKSKTIVVGAHYDVSGNQEGADDNASGVVGLLELARLLEGKMLDYTIELVAYSLEEPPFFGTDKMGSYIHAQSLIEEKVQVYGMLSLEMIGYFDEAERSQAYPLPILSAIHGTKGNFITLVGKTPKGRFATKFGIEFQKLDLIRTVPFEAPVDSSIVNLSDHINYWKFGFSALMITDTAFLRNRNYHSKGDTMEKLNLTKMAKVIDSVYETLVTLK